MLETRNLTIRFGGHVAVDGVSCAFQPGTLTAIVGPNGAGKTTYFNLISGQLRATAGPVPLDGGALKLEVAMLMALEPSVYMFDEPTAGMSVDDVPVILDLVRALKSENDKTILLVEHKMDVVRELADRIIVLHNGQLVADGDPATVIASPVVQNAYLGLTPQAEAA